MVEPRVGDRAGNDLHYATSEAPVREGRPVRRRILAFPCAARRLRMNWQRRQSPKAGSRSNPIPVSVVGHAAQDGHGAGEDLRSNGTTMQKDVGLSERSHWQADEYGNAIDRHAASAVWQDLQPYSIEGSGPHPLRSRELHSAVAIPDRKQVRRRRSLRAAWIRELAVDSPLRHHREHRRRIRGAVIPAE